MYEQYYGVENKDLPPRDSAAIDKSEFYNDKCKFTWINATGRATTDRAAATAASRPLVLPWASESESKCNAGASKILKAGQNSQSFWNSIVKSNFGFGDSRLDFDVDNPNLEFSLRGI